MKKARIKSNQKHSPFGLQVSIDEGKGKAYWDRTDDGSKNFFVLDSSIRSARKLAQWILDNTEEQS